MNPVIPSSRPPGALPSTSKEDVPKTAPEHWQGKALPGQAHGLDAVNNGFTPRGAELAFEAIESMQENMQDAVPPTGTAAASAMRPSELSIGDLAAAVTGALAGHVTPGKPPPSALVCTAISELAARTG